MKNAVRLFLAFFSCVPLKAQLPISHLYSFEIDNDSLVSGSARLISGINLNGYNDHPAFIDSDRLTFSMAWHVDDQTDIYTYDLRQNELMPITLTSTQEMFPQMQDSFWYCIRIDSNDAHWLWRYPLSGEDQGRRMLVTHENVGNFKSYNKDSAVLFLRGEPNQLVILSIKDQAITPITNNIGETFFVHENFIYYLHKLSESNWYIKKYDPNLRKATIVTRAITGIEKFFMDVKGGIWCAQGGKIFKSTSDKSFPWREVFDLTTMGLFHISGLTFYENHLICVDQASL